MECGCMRVRQRALVVGLVAFGSGAVVHAADVRGEVWRPGCVSTAAQETSLTRHPNGEKAWFMRGDFASNSATLLELSVNAEGCALQVAAFSGVWRDSEPHVSADGRRLYFVSNRPVAEDPVEAEWNGRRFPGAQIWYVALDESGEVSGEPQRVQGETNAVTMVYNPATTANGDLYVSSHRRGSGPGYQIYVARWDADRGAHGAVEQLDLGPVERSRMDPTLSPDGQWLAYAGDEGDSLGSADIYVTQRQNDGRWGPSKRLPAPVNSMWLENAPAWGEQAGVLYVTSARPNLLSHTAKRPVSLAELERRLLQDPLNGSRNVWRFELGESLHHDSSNAQAQPSRLTPNSSAQTRTMLPPRSALSH